MDWITSIKEIQKARENNRLVIFVGSGVSNNSGVPTWGGLIEAIADEIGYEGRCDKCREQIEDCPDKSCRNRFTADEFLKIPEYYFQSVENEDEYHNLIKQTLSANVESNAIDEEILRILPQHIITTNYDKLLENAKSDNTIFYKVVSQDSELLSRINDRYIIKMHGDIEDPKTMILKESDYIEYEQRHPLVTTYIKSLLVNHTFLFLGYSLNDSNLNLIVGWINYFCSQNSVKTSERPNSFIIFDKEVSKFETERLKSKNIHVISLNKLPLDVEEKITVPPELTVDSGRKLYCYLKCISDNSTFFKFVSLEEMLVNKYQILTTYNRISYDDLFAVYSFGQKELLGNMMQLFDSETYNHLAMILKKGNLLIKEIFLKSGINQIYDISGQNINIEDESNEDEVFRCYLDNMYQEVNTRIKVECNLAKKYYYTKLLSPEPIMEEIISDDKEYGKDTDYISILLCKLQNRLNKMTVYNRQLELQKELESWIKLAPTMYENAIKRIGMIVNGESKNKSSMEKILLKHKERYDSKNEKWYSNHCFYEMWKLRAYAYDYYYFFKKNFLSLDYFSDPKDYLAYYLEAIICTYSPVIEKTNSLGFSKRLEQYPLEEIDLDMFVKYCSPKLLQKWIKDYSVSKIKVDEQVNIVQKYKNYCESYTVFKTYYWPEQLLCFSLIITLVELTDEEKSIILQSIKNLLEGLLDSPWHMQKLYETVDLVVSKFAGEGTSVAVGLLMETLLNEKIYGAITTYESYKLNRLLNSLASYSTGNCSDALQKMIEAILEPAMKCQRIIALRKLLPMDEYVDYLLKHITFIRSDDLLYLVLDRYITYSDDIKSHLLSTLSKAAESKKVNPGMITYPDSLSDTINTILIFLLADCELDKELLMPYVEYSEHLAFALNPEVFDYSKVDLAHYMWGNFFRSEKYQHYFVEHKSELLTQELEKTFSLGLATEEQRKGVYGVLLSQNDLWQYGR